ncbi:MAG: hypothetical protein RLP14_05900 [Owenweeksia sp.]
MKKPKKPLAELKKRERILGEGVPDRDLNQKRIKRLKKRRKGTSKRKRR